MEQKYISEAVMRTFERNLETELNNECLQYRRDDATMKELQEYLEQFRKTHPLYILYTNPSNKVLFIHKRVFLTPLPFPSKKKILGKEHDSRLKVEEIAAALACRAKSSTDRKNFEIFNLKTNLEVFKTKTKI